MTYAVGMVGLGVMGANLARNMAGRGYAVAGIGHRSASCRRLTMWP